MTRVFVYGSLRKNYGNHRLLEQSPYLGGARTQEAFTMVSLGAYPAVLPDGATAIVGEVYEVDDRVFARLDQLEGYPSFYNRMLIPTEYGDAWMYYLNSKHPDERFQVVESGDWSQHYRRAP